MRSILAVNYSSIRNESVNGEIYYVVGRPAYIKYEFFNALSAATEDHNFLRIPRLFTTCPTISESSHAFIIDERDFELRDSMGIYGLSWETNGHKFGICAEGSQWVQNGYSVVINGSLHNLNQAMKVWPELNVVLLRMEDQLESAVDNILIESDQARLDWVDSISGICCPYILSISEESGVEDASRLLLDFINYSRNSMLEKSA